MLVFYFLGLWLHSTGYGLKIKVIADKIEVLQNRMAERVYTGMTCQTIDKIRRWSFGGRKSLERQGSVIVHWPEFPHTASLVFALLEGVAISSVPEIVRNMSVDSAKFKVSSWLKRRTFLIAKPRREC